MARVYSVDSMGCLRDVDGFLVDMAASAYDTCMLLGHDPLYAEDDVLPQKVVDYYGPFGDVVLSYAGLGWARGREFTMKDPWQPKEKVDHGRRRPRAASRKTVVTNPQPGDTITVTADGPETWFSKPSARNTRSGQAPLLAPFTVEVNVEDVILTAAVIRERLEKETRVLLRKHLEKHEWEPITSGDTVHCRTVREVFRTLRLRSTVNGPWTEIRERLERELRFVTPSATKAVHELSSL